MRCTKCGAEIEGKFCGNCGTSVVNEELVQEVQSVADVKTVEPVQGVQPVQSNNMMNNNQYTNNYGNEQYINYQNYNTNTNSTNKKNNKVLVIVGGIVGFLFLFVVAVIIIRSLDGTKLKWVENDDYKIKYAQPTTLHLSVEAYDKHKEEIGDIDFTVSGGEVKKSGTSATWVLPDKDGEYTITAKAPSGKKIKKKIKVVSEKVNFDDKIEMDAKMLDQKESDDTDADGLSNEEEKKNGTNPELKDTDSDGLSDYYEINVSKTDPKKDDSDDDGLLDGAELDLGLDPLKKDSKGDGVNDGDRDLTYKVTDKNGVILEINGKGNLSKTTVEVFENNAVAKINGMTGRIYDFNTNGQLNKAIVKIRYDAEEIKNRGLNEDTLTLYYFNEETKEFEPQKTVVDKKNKIITVELTHFSKYVLGDSSVVASKNAANIMFVIDNSVSMYTEQQMRDAGYNSSTGAVGNDKDFKRLKLTNDMVDKFTGNYKFGVAEFSGNYVNLEKFTDNKDNLKNSVNSMESKWKSNMSGTNIISALKEGIKEFENDKEVNYLLLLTDGKNTEGSFTTSVKDEIINSAKEKNTKVCVIGLGTSVDSDELNYIAEKTGCDYYNASSSTALAEIYARVGADINYNYVDTDGDNKVDGMVLLDSGFLVTRDGFNFGNYRSSDSEDGNCYGMATFAMLKYTGKLPSSLGSIDTKAGLLGKKFHSDGYSLGYYGFAKDKNLYDYDIKNDALDMYLHRNYNNSFVSKDGKKWTLNTKEYKAFKEIGADFKTIKSNGKEYEVPIININSDEFKEALETDDEGMMSAIWRLFVLQFEDEDVSFITNPDKAFEELKANLNTGNPIVISFENSDGAHAVNATKLIQDLKDSNKYKIEIYDNNHPGESKYIEVSRSKFSKIQLDYTAWTNEYEYKFKYEGQDIKLNVNKLTVK